MAGLDGHQPVPAARDVEAQRGALGGLRPGVLELVAVAEDRIVHPPHVFEWLDTRFAQRVGNEHFDQTFLFAHADAAATQLAHVGGSFGDFRPAAKRGAPVRAGSDIAFLGGVINYVIGSEKWNTDPFFKSFVVNYTNAATIISEDFKDTEELNGVFSGLLQSKGGVKEWPFNGITNQYDGASWQYARTKVGAQGEAAAPTAHSGETKVSTGGTGQKDAPAGQAAAKSPQGPPFAPLVASLVKPEPRSSFLVVIMSFSSAAAPQSPAKVPAGALENS